MFRSALILILLTFISVNALHAQDAKQLLRQLNQKFQLLTDYQANVAMAFQIPGVKMKSLRGKVLFKKPNKFKVRAKGIFFLPKQNPMQTISGILQDTNAYTAVSSGYELVNGVNCAVINLIPTKSSDELVLAKFWIDTKIFVVLKSQVTTKNNGSIETQSKYGSQVKYGLPDQITILVDVAKVKVPKMMSIDLNKKSKKEEAINGKEKGSIELILSDYKINKKLQDSEFLIEE